MSAAILHAGRNRRISYGNVYSSHCFGEIVVDDFVAFSRLLDALRPWLGHLVIVGGWAHRLHRFHERAHSPAYATLRTKDADIAFPTTAPIEGDIAAALKDAGFHETSSVDHTPPITQYRLVGDGGGFYAEFLVPLHGSVMKRNGKPDITMAKAGVIAQKVRYLDLLLLEPWAVRLTQDMGLPLQSPIEVMVPNPVSFIAQKLLIRKNRGPEKQAQDALYVHDTLGFFGGELPMLRALWSERVRPILHEKTARSVERFCRQQFGIVDDVIRSAARMPQDRTIQPERFQATCMYGLEEIFATTSESEGTGARQAGP
jgi:hypothetical protein